LIERPKGNFSTANELPLKKGKAVELLGAVVAVKDTRTVKGDRMNFATFVDEQGYFFDTVHFPPVIARFPFRGRGMYRISGKVCEEFGFFSVETVSMEKIPYKARGY
jgi:DNA polymerase-3 subunit alpha